jgi:hypothetical protein
MKAYEGKICIAPLILNLGARLSSSQLQDQDALPLKKNPGTERVGYWMDPRAGVDVLGEKKTELFCPYRDSNPRSSSQEYSQYTDHAIPGLQVYLLDLNTKNPKRAHCKLTF